VVLFPNPTQDEVNVLFEKTTSEPSPLRIYDAIGKLVFSTLVPAETKLYKPQIQHLARGNYNLVVDADGTRRTVIKFRKL
jgi:Secretion system C-terminal sorting domain